MDALAPRMQRPRLAWLELTTTEGPAASAFYGALLDAEVDAVDMESYQDYSLESKTNGAFGVCRPESSENSFSSGWVPYFEVEDLDAALDQVPRLGGVVVRPPSEDADASGRFGVVRDPAGHAAVLFEAGDDADE